MIGYEWRKLPRQPAALVAGVWAEGERSILWKETRIEQGKDHTKTSDENICNYSIYLTHIEYQIKWNRYNLLYICGRQSYIDKLLQLSLIIDLPQHSVNCHYWHLASRQLVFAKQIWFPSTTSTQRPQIRRQSWTKRIPRLNGLPQ